MTKDEQIAQLQQVNIDLMNRNMQLSQQLDAYYDVRRRVQMLKELVIRHKELLQQTDLRDDDELMAIIETRLEQEPATVNGEFNAAQLAQMLGVSQSRLARLFRNTTYKSADDYLDYLRLLRAMQMLREHPEYGIAAISEDAGFNSVRTFQRKCNEAVGMSPVEFRMLVDQAKKQL